MAPGHASHKVAGPGGKGQEGGGGPAGAEEKLKAEDGRAAVGCEEGLGWDDRSAIQLTSGRRGGGGEVCQADGGHAAGDAAAAGGEAVGGARGGAVI